jgi:hypothetical protein
MAKPTKLKDPNGAIYAALAKRFQAPEWAFLTEVANGTGGHAKRAADAVAINTWPSRGLELHGVEVKVTRSDWLRELKNPAKSEPVQRYCHRWWIATLPDVVRDDELPSTWGLLILKGKTRLVASVQAPELKPVAPDMAIVASLGRRMQGGVEGAMARARREIDSGAEYDRGYADGKAMFEAAAPRVHQEYERLKRTVETFEQHAGVSLRHHHAATMGNSLRDLIRLRTQGGDPLWRLTHTIDGLSQAAEQLRLEHKVLQGFREEMDQQASPEEALGETGVEATQAPCALSADRTARTAEAG